MKRKLRLLFISIFSLVSLLLIGIVAAIIYIFLNPEVILKEKYLKMVLDKTKVLDNYSWSAVVLDHERISWNKRVLRGKFDDLCFEYSNATTHIANCSEKIFWNFEISWGLTSGLVAVANKPLTIDSSFLSINLIKSDEVTPKSNEVVNYLSYWDMIWKPVIPDADLNFRRIEFNNDALNNSRPLLLNAHLIKNHQELNLSVLEYRLDATPKSFHLYAPKRIKIPQDFIKHRSLYLDRIGLKGRINKNTVDLNLGASIDQASLVLSTTISNKQLSSELMNPTVQSEVLKNTKGRVLIKNVKQSLGNILPPPFNILPAPLNAMEGDLSLDLIVSSYLDKTSVSLDFLTQLDMTGVKQRINLDLTGQFPFDLKNYKLGSLNLGLNIKELRLLLPNLARNKLPPKLMPDSRIVEQSVVKAREIEAEKKAKDPIKYDLEIKALGKDLVTLNTNLLDNPLKMNLDFLLNNNGVQDGTIRIKPLKTTFFNRKIEVEDVKIVFNTPLETTVDAFINFDLPEYLVKLHLEGPLSAPRMVLSSVPPLPQSDIYAVLLFGRPMTDLANDDSTAAENTSRMISQGVLNLAVLYYLAGSPIEAIGYNSQSNELSAQIGLGSKNSLRVGGTDSGLNSAGVRRSLGKGWYIDSSIQKSTETANGSNFGVLLERIIAY